MQPKSKVEYDKKSLKALKKTIKTISIPRREREKNPSYCTDLPEVIGIKLTNRCNLRCKHCYQWNDDGYHQYMDKNMQNTDIDFEIIKKIILETENVNSRLYLWGGEPLCYNQFEQLAELLEKENREVVLCTNGVFLEKFIDEIIKLPSNLELLIPIEGFEEQHDAIRGKGNFNKVMNAINMLGTLKSKGIFKGKISVHTVINDEMVDKLYDLLEFFETKPIDFVLLTYPWYISNETSKQMDDYFIEHFEWLNTDNVNEEKSWHAFKYRLNPEKIPTLIDSIKKINKKTWNLRVRYQPGLEFDQIEDFVLGNTVCTSKHKHCLVLSTRMDITPNGEVTACKFFNEFSVGNLNNHSIYELWHSERYNKIRETIHYNWMPVCSKCNVLYLHD